MTPVFTSSRPGCHGGQRGAALRPPRRTWLRRWAACAAAVAALFVSVVGNTAWAQTATNAKPAPEVWAKDMREEVVRINVTVTDMYGRQETRPMPITVFRPTGEGRRPLVVFNHGRAVDSQRAAQGRSRAEHTARHAASLPNGDASRGLMVGVSVGGLTSLTTVAHRMTGYANSWLPSRHAPLPWATRGLGVTPRLTASLAGRWGFASAAASIARSVPWMTTWSGPARGDARPRE